MANSPDESSWTFYIQGFMCDNDDDQITITSSEFESPSLVSDAASSPVKELANNYTGPAGPALGFSSAKLISKQNSFKKQKTCKVIPAMDLDLEDTASSPVNSPKVSYMSQFADQKEKAKINIAEVKRNIFSKRGVFAVERDTNYGDLEKIEGAVVRKIV